MHDEAAVRRPIPFEQFAAFRRLEKANPILALPEATAGLGTEIIAVDNGSTDGSPEMLAGEFPHVRLVRNAENAGFARANNIGIRRVKGRSQYLGQKIFRSSLG